LADAILGPVLSDIQKLAGGERFALVSAFYSAPRLNALAITADSADIMVRLDLSSIDAWVLRIIAPDALLGFWKRHSKVDMSVYYGPNAHAKIYAGDKAFLIGSANFTVRGLSGTANEVLWRETRPAERSSMKQMLKKYKAGLTLLSIQELEDYVSSNIKTVRKLQKNAPRSPEDFLPRQIQRSDRTGSYQKFLLWLTKQASPAASVVLARANGDGNLSGHIRMNFYGIRQFLLASPLTLKALKGVNPTTYSLAGDGTVNDALREFVETEAVDEGRLVVDTWRTYLPEAAGGKPKSGGGTSGNLNRMLPLMARYLSLSLA